MFFSHSILAMALSTLLFVGGHFLMSHPLRGALIGALGDRGFRGVYSLVAGVALIWMIYAHITAPYVELWPDSRAARWLALILMLPATLMVTLSFGTPNPGNPGGERARLDYDSGLGALAIARHPGLTGFALWAIAHAIVNGDAATLILCAGIFVLSVGGMAGIDARKMRAIPDLYGPFMAHTSRLPFAALLAGRVRFSWDKVGWKRIGIGLAVFVVLILLHPFAIGRSALPV